MEKLADDLGQVAFRLETNFSLCRKRLDLVQAPGSIQAMAAAEAIKDDLERLKEIKGRIAGLKGVEPCRTGAGTS